MEVLCQRPLALCIVFLAESIFLRVGRETEKELQQATEDLGKASHKASIVVFKVGHVTSFFRGRERSTTGHKAVAEGTRSLPCLVCAPVMLIPQHIVCREDHALHRKSSRRH